MLSNANQEKSVRRTSPVTILLRCAVLACCCGMLNSCTTIGNLLNSILQLPFKAIDAVCML
ncbi:MAG: hypothetical protein Q4A24_00295 [Akkermansia sp.]|nr:hypothetical protein [Akkermansia sp.]MDO4750516.1 hypothetical protein [Akkermansia sp.]